MTSKVPPPQLKTEMTPFPYHIDGTATLEAAAAMMREHDIRHLPVMYNHQLAGIVAERDVNRALAHGGESLTVMQICTASPYIADMHASLEVVARELSEHDDDAALIVREGKLVGIFTSTDACRVLASVLEECYPHPDDGVA